MASRKRTPPAPEQPSTEAARDRIVTAALDVFAERGFDGAATREIAARAGVTQPLINYHFSGKLELWQAAVDSIFEILEHTLAARVEGLRGVDDVTTAKLIVREFVVFSAHHPQLHRIITGECKAEGPRMDWLVDRHIRQTFATTTEMFARLAEAGHVPAIAPAHLYYILTGAGATIFVLAPECRRAAGIDPSSDAVIEAHADAVVRLLFPTSP